MQTNIAIAGIESYQPAVDYKRANRVGVLSGRNFAWDASGVYAAYASRLVAGASSIGVAPNMAESLDLGDWQLVAVENKVYSFVPASPGSPVGVWDLRATLVAIVSSNPLSIDYNYRRWSAAYLGGQRYACSYNYGVFRVAGSESAPTLTRLTSGTVPGFPADASPVIGICETNGRMCYVTKDTFYWSAPAAPENLVPAIGGAGFQVINERIGGTVICMTPLAAGVIIWTTEGGLVCEFIGGDFVFRYWVLNTKTTPITSYAITRLPDDDYVILTQLGLFSLNNLGQPQPITPMFNEFLREYMRMNPGRKGHTIYTITDNRLYVTFKRVNNLFDVTYALDIVLDRWGVFSLNHMGILAYGPDRGQLAYVNSAGIASYFLSAVDGRKNREDHANPGTYVPLDSEVMLGWIRAEELVRAADVEQELNVVSVNRTVPYQPVIVTYADEGLVLSAGVASHWDEGLVTDFLSAEVIDEGSVTDENNAIAYTLTAYTDLFYSEIPEEQLAAVQLDLAIQDRYADTWTGFLPARYHRLKFEATELGQFFRINSLDVTVSFNGRQV